MMLQIFSLQQVTITEKHFKLEHVQIMDKITIKQRGETNVNNKKSFIAELV